jgi:integrase
MQLYRKRQGEHGRARAEVAEWVFVNNAGRLIDENRPRKVFAKILAHAALPNHTVYDLRHTFATLHLAKGHPITYVSAQLGHSSPSTTLRWYAHWLPTSGKRYADSLDTSGLHR